MPNELFEQVFFEVGREETVDLVHQIKGEGSIDLFTPFVNCTRLTKNGVKTNGPNFPLSYPNETAPPRFYHHQ